MELIYAFDFVKDKLENIYYAITNGVPQVIKWFPLIWTIRDWDSFFLLMVMQFQMANMRANIDEYSLHVTKDRDIKTLSICIACVERLLEDDHHSKRDDQVHPDLKFSTDYRFRLATKRMDGIGELLFKTMRAHYREWWD